MRSKWRILSRQPAKGVSLLELLIVMTIIVMVTAAAIPIMLPALQNRRMRETSRLVSSYLSSARSRAIETGRPVGVMFERFNGLPYCISLSQVEVPPPYAGDTSTSTIEIDNTGKITKFTQGDIQWTGQVRYGDIVKVGYRNQPYMLISNTALLPLGRVVPLDPASVAWYLVNLDGTVPMFPANYANGVAFQILRQPTRSAAAPLQLPEGCVIDLLGSGMGFGGQFPSAGIPPTISFNPVLTFAPGGSIDYVYAPNSSRPTGPLFFLLGVRELLPDISKSMTDENIFEPTGRTHLKNFWISVGHQTGLVTVSENGVTIGPTDITGARAYAQSAQGVAGM